MSMTSDPRTATKDIKAVSPPEFFRVTELLEPGGKAKATRMYDTGEGEGRSYNDVTYMEEEIHDPNHMTFRLPFEIVQARFHRGNARYETVKSSGLYRHVKADGAIPQGSEGDCTVYSGKTKALASSEETISVCNAWVPQTINAGDQLYARYIPFTERWWFLPGSDNQMFSDVYLCNFTLTSALSLHGTASATVGACSDDVAGIFGSPITVEDWIGKFKGPIGYRGAAFKYKSDTSCNWQIIEMEEKAEWIECTLDGPFSAGITTATVIDYWQGEDPGNQVDLRDPCDLYGHLETGDCVLACYHEVLDDYQVADGPVQLCASANCHPTNGRRSLADATPYVSEPPADADCPVAELRVNQDALIAGFYDDVNDRFIIGIDVAERGSSMMISNGTQVRWSEQGNLGHSLYVGGTQTNGSAEEFDEPYITLAGNDIVTTLAMSWTWSMNVESAEGEQVWLKPVTDGPHQSHLICKGTDGADGWQMQLDWTDSMPDGYFIIGDSTVGWRQVNVTMGLITGCQAATAPTEAADLCSLSVPANPGATTVSRVDPSEQDPCDDLPP